MSDEAKKALGEMWRWICNDPVKAQAEIDRQHAQQLAMQMVKDYGRGLHGADPIGISVEDAVRLMQANRAQQRQIEDAALLTSKAAAEQQRRMQSMAGSFGSGGSGGVGAQVDPVAYQKHLMDQQQAMAQAKYVAKREPYNPFADERTGQRKPQWIPPKVSTFVPYQILTGPLKTRQLEVTAVMFDAMDPRRKFRTASVAMVLARPEGPKRPDLQALAQLCLRSASKFYKQLYSLSVVQHIGHDSQAGMHVTMTEMEPEPGNKNDGMSSEVPF